METCTTATAPITVDDLSSRLRSVRYKRWLDKEYNVPQRSLDIKSFHRNTPMAALNYFNNYFCIGIDTYNRILTEEEEIGILHDLANLPLDMVIERIRNQGIFVD